MDGFPHETSVLCFHFKTRDTCSGSGGRGGFGCNPGETAYLQRREVKQVVRRRQRLIYFIVEKTDIFKEWNSFRNAEPVAMIVLPTIFKNGAIFAKTHPVMMNSMRIKDMLPLMHVFTINSIMEHSRPRPLLGLKKGWFSGLAQILMVLYEVMQALKKRNLSPFFLIPYFAMLKVQKLLKTP